jgi:hypothetical protein
MHWLVYGNLLQFETHKIKQWLQLLMVHVSVITPFSKILLP